MKTRQSIKLLCGMLLLNLGAGIVHAQESFVVSGPLNSFQNYVSGETLLDYTFTATVYYDSTAPVTGSYSAPGAYEELYFDYSIIAIEYSIHDGSGIQIASFAEDGVSDLGIVNYIKAQDGISGISEDSLRYDVYAQGLAGLSRALIQFQDNLGNMLSALSAIPEVPVAGEYDTALAMFQFMDLDANVAFNARGEIVAVTGGDIDPYEECAAQAKNHGQFVKCVAHVSNALRAAGEMTGAEKGSAQSAAAQLEE